MKKVLFFIILFVSLVNSQSKSSILSEEPDKARFSFQVMSSRSDTELREFRPKVPYVFSFDSVTDAGSPVGSLGSTSSLDSFKPHEPTFWQHAESSDGSITVGAKEYTKVFVPPEKRVHRYFRLSDGQYKPLHEAYLWRNGAPESLGRLESGPQSVALACDDKGRVIVGSIQEGYGLDGNGVDAFVWTQSSGMRSIRQVLVEKGVKIPDGFQFMKASNISGDGKVVTGIGKKDHELLFWQAIIPTVTASPNWLDHTVQYAYLFCLVAIKPIHWMASLKGKWWAR